MRLVTILYATYDYDEQIHRGIAEYGQANGFTVKVIHPHNFHILQNQDNISGIISSFMPEEQESAMSQFLMDVGFPIVDLTLNYAEKEIPRFIPDLRTSGKLAASHLLSQGVKELGYVGWGLSWHDDLRVKTYQETALQYGHNVNLCYFRHQKKSRHTLIQEHIKSLTLPAGIYISYDRVGSELIKAVLELGLRIPEDIAIISGQRREVDSAYLPIPITTIDLNMRQQGHNAAEALHRLIKGEELAANVHFTPGAKVIQRDSSSSTEKSLFDAIQYIDENINERMNVDQLALKVGTSRASLQRQFKDMFGCGVATEIRRRRLNQAKILLIDSDMSANAIADKLGYASVAQFYRLFKKESGLTCGEYRERHMAV